MVKIVVSYQNAQTNPDDAWNSVCSHPMQSQEWAFVRSIHGVEVLVLKEYDSTDNKLKAIFTVTIHSIPHTPYKVAYIPKSAVPSKDILNKLNIIAKEKNIVFAKFEPDTLKSLASVTNIPHDFVQSTHPIFTKYNQLLDLRPSVDELFAKMHTKTRYNIRLAKKRNVKVVEMSNEAGYKIFEKLYFDTCKRQKYRGHTKSYHRAIWETLGKQESATNTSLTSKILIAYLGEEPLAVFQLWKFQNRMYYVYGGSSTTHRAVMAPNILMWEAILLARSMGCEVFDMWGSLSREYDDKDPWAGFTRFKQGYGTEFVEYLGSFDVVYRPFLYRLYSVAHAIRQKLI